MIAYPTEGVWGLGCEPLNQHACRRIVKMKQRGGHKGFILIASDFAQVQPFLAHISRPKLAKVFRTWPGPVTWLLPAAEWVPKYLTGGRKTLAVRVTAHETAKALCAQYGGPLVSTSANLSGRTPARTALHVQRQFGDAVDYLVPGALGGRTRPTQIRDFATGKVLRT